MKQALFINGIFETVLDEIIRGQKAHPGRVFYLQPYSGSEIKLLKTKQPSPDSPIKLYATTTDKLDRVSYMAKIVGWQNKHMIPREDLTVLDENIKKYQPKEESIYMEVNGKKCANLIFVSDIRKLDVMVPIGEFTKTTDKTLTCPTF